jgi:carboxyl-terminal processing protease
VGVTSQFVGSGDVLQVRDAKGNVDHIKVESGGMALDIPLVVLINQGSASAAEIVAGAIQDAGRGHLIGETTFGTGTVLNQFGLSDNSALLLATGEWLTPKGRVIWHQGIKPDEEVVLDTQTLALFPDEVKTLAADSLSSSVKDNQFLAALHEAAAVKAASPTP